MKSFLNNGYVGFMLLALVLFGITQSTSTKAADRFTGQTAQATPAAGLPSDARQIYLPLLMNGAATANVAPTTQLATPALIDQAFANGDITADARALYLAYALYEPQSLPAQFHSNVGWYGTQSIREVQNYMQSISASSTDAVQQELSRLSVLAETVCDTEDGPNTLNSTNFHFNYGTILGGLTIADYVTSMEATFAIEVTQFGWAEPPLNANNPFNRYPVQIFALGGGLYGYVSGGGGGDYTGFIGDNPNTPATETEALSSCMVLNSNFEPFPETTQGALDATTSHEFVHAIQNGYGDPDEYEDAMWYESSAAYMEDEIFDDANSNYSYLWPEVENCLGEWPNNGAPGGISQYSNFLFFRHVAEHNGGTNVAGGGEDVMQHFWENVAAGQDALVAYNNALVDEGTNLPDAFHTYAIAAKFSKACGAGYADPYCFEEGADHVVFMGALPPVHGAIGANPGTYSDSIKNHYAANWVTLPTSGSPYQVTLSNTAAGGQLRGSLVCDTGSAFTITPFSAVAGAGASTSIASFNAVGCTSVVAVITNQQQTSGNPSSCASHGYTVAVSAVAATPTATPTGTNTPVPPTATSTPTHTTVPPTVTSTATPTATPSATASPTATGTSVPPTATSTVTPTGTPTTGSQPGNCNSDAAVDAGDISAVILEIFDGDGTDVNTVAGGTFPGGPGCDANEDTMINAADISCTVLLIFNGPNACGGSPNAAAQTSAHLKIKDIRVDLAEEAATVDITVTSRGNAASAVAFVVNYDATWLRFDASDRNGDGLPDAVTLPFATDGKHVTVTDRGGQLAIAVADISAAPTSFADGTLLTISFAVNRPVGRQAVTSELAFSHEEAASLGSVAGTVIPVTTQDGLVTVAPVEIVSQIYLPFLIAAE